MECSPMGQEDLESGEGDGEGKGGMRVSLGSHIKHFQRTKRICSMLRNEQGEPTVTQ